MKEFLLDVLEPYATEEQFHTAWLRELTKDIRTTLPFLARHIPLDKNFSVLEVGTGRSGVACMFANRTSAIYSITLSDEELAHANSLNISHYKTIIHNKHVPIPDSFIPDNSLDYVVDVNLASFSRMWQWTTYLLLRKVKPGGYLVTQEYGMTYVQRGVGTCALSEEMLDTHQKLLGYKLEKFPELAGEWFGVYLLKKLPKQQHR